MSEGLNNSLSQVSVGWLIHTGLLRNFPVVALRVLCPRQTKMVDYLKNVIEPS